MKLSEIKKKGLIMEDCFWVVIIIVLPVLYYIATLMTGVFLEVSNKICY